MGFKKIYKIIIKTVFATGALIALSALKARWAISAPLPKPVNQNLVVSRSLVESSENSSVSSYQPTENISEYGHTLARRRQRRHVTLERSAGISSGVPQYAGDINTGRSSTEIQDIYVQDNESEENANDASSIEIVTLSDPRRLTGDSNTSSTKSIITLFKRIKNFWLCGKFELLNLTEKQDLKEEDVIYCYKNNIIQWNDHGPLPKIENENVSYLCAFPREMTEGTFSDGTARNYLPVIKAGVSQDDSLKKWKQGIKVFNKHESNPTKKIFLSETEKERAGNSATFYINSEDYIKYDAHQKNERIEFIVVLGTDSKVYVRQLSSFRYSSRKMDLKKWKKTHLAQLETDICTSLPNLKLKEFVYDLGQKDHFVGKNESEYIGRYNNQPCMRTTSKTNQSYKKYAANENLTITERHTEQFKPYSETLFSRHKAQTAYSLSDGSSNPQNFWLKAYNDIKETDPFGKEQLAIIQAFYSIHEYKLIETASKVGRNYDVNVSGLNLSSETKEKFWVKQSNQKQKFNNHKLNFQAKSFIKKSHNWIETFDYNQAMNPAEVSILLSKFKEICQVSYKLTSTAIGVFNLGASSSEKQPFCDLYKKELTNKFTSLIQTCSDKATELVLHSPSNDSAIIQNNQNSLGEIENYLDKKKYALDIKFRTDQEFIDKVTQSFEKGVDLDLDVNQSPVTGPRSSFFKLDAAYTYNQEYNPWGSSSVFDWSDTSSEGNPYIM